ncbi:hypothetical protein HAX54_051457 [Datura stramonium]|uniref:Uncharacterized protein n=1 Tax=Datura stramonium TaxID=4076 RepID=A0ABS8SY55_DATST|nr:hypothetical protein [Datura stramonium]
MKVRRIRLTTRSSGKKVESKKYSWGQTSPEAPPPACSVSLTNMLQEGGVVQQLLISSQFEPSEMPELEGVE